MYAKTGTGKLQSWQDNENLNNPSLYLPSDGLVDAVNVALTLGQPLMLTGEPGTGKTQLAFHIAHFFGLGKPLRFNSQTTSTANDLFYTYDALGHFQFNQNSDVALNNDAIEQMFIRYNALGAAIIANERKVVLIDEIDKAPRDLPNNVLAAIEDLEFTIPQINKNYKANKDKRPIIIITSNSEKNLPDAFLRRVIYFHIDFPGTETLLSILALKSLNATIFNEKSAAEIEKLKAVEQQKLEPLVAHFESIRNGLKLKKQPATAELIFWMQFLKKSNFDVSKLADVKGLSDKEKAILLTSYSVLAKNKDDLELLKGNLGSGRKRRRR
ncbi:MAG: AAA family ATPase [Saprospiraceae bacterium]